MDYWMSSTQDVYLLMNNLSALRVNVTHTRTMTIYSEIFLEKLKY